MRPAARSARAALVLLGVLATPLCATAATRASGVQVSAEIAATCRLTGSATDPNAASSPGAVGSTIALTCTKGVTAIVASQRPGDRAASLHATRAGGPALQAIERRAQGGRPSGGPDTAPLYTTIQF
jgi:hypothetical protein